ncbi:MAG: AAA family ATPase [Muribaculaceae bacterium]|nr:AAA family ATPase [Muribaculaceae bacterium]
MKIKRLVIRNIASIEQGEIDFEHGLIDQETGKQASLFLITGDTGSGKSVILDCISMSLYGTTPRVKSVNGVKNNVYRNNDGEEISVNDITQYTRIGISWKDDCYSELSFSGNDNIEYVARYSLGRTSHRNYRRPEWILKIGDSEIIENRKDEIKERIQKAVGLSFEQFSRMAMLAQGQFATFLTGKKEERERILEQLTATDIFSRYGEAISNIYKNSRQEAETTRKIYDEFKKKILDDSMRLELLAEQAEKIEKASLCQTETEKLRQRIHCTGQIIKATEAIYKLKEESLKLNAVEDTAEYRKNRKILDLWDATTRQRELLSDKIKSSGKLASDRIALQEMKSELLFLTADLSERQETLDTKSTSLEQLKIWIDSKEHFKTLFSESKAVISDINRYLSLGKEIEKKEADKTKVKEETEELNQKISFLKEDVANKSNECQECQSLINDKSNAREKQNPISLRKEKEMLIKRESSLNVLSTKLLSTESERQEYEIIEKEIIGLNQLLSDLKEKSDKKTEESKRLEKEKDASESRYRTMLLSVEEKFAVLRKKLVDEHATNCPLCGLPIQDHFHEWSNEEYFSDILSPLEEEKNKLTEAYNEAKKKSDEAKEKMIITTGSIKAKEDDLKKRKKSLINNENDIRRIISTLGITASDNQKSIISNELSAVKKAMDDISKKLEITDLLQKEIDALFTKKQSLDLKYKSADKTLQHALKSLTQKQEELRQTGVRVEELKMDKESLHEKISSALKDYAIDWLSNPSEIISNLKKGAKEYSDKVSSYAKEEPEHRAQLKTLDSILAIKNNISGILESINPMESDIEFGDVRSMNLVMLQEMWHNFHIEVSAVNNRITENNFKIIEINNALEDFYEIKGISEATLRQLLEAADEISRIRTQEEQHINEVQKNKTLLEEATRTKDENMKALNLEDESKLDNIETLSNELNSLTKNHSELTQRLGAIKEILSADEKTRLESKKQRDEFEQKKVRMEKWEKMNKYFGGSRFRTLVQSHILRPLLRNANIFLRQITDHYTLTCSDENEQLSILVLDRYHNNEPRSVTVLSGGERFMISLALSLALSAMNRPDMNVDILFIDEGFGTLDSKSLDMVMSTLRRLPEINGQTGRRVGVISHREELTEQIPTQVQLQSYGAGRSRIVISV